LSGSATDIKHDYLEDSAQRETVYRLAVSEPTVPICPKCHKLITESHYQRHLKRCGTSHRHVTQSLYVPSATAQIESPNRGITYGPSRTSYTNKSKKSKWRRWLIWSIVAVLLLVGLGVFFSSFTSIL
jgi:hypothetical protein